MKRLLTDALLALVLTVPSILGTFGVQEGSPMFRQLDLFGAVLVILTGAMIAIRREWPEAALIAAALVVAVYLGQQYAYGPVVVLVMIPAYSVARYRPLKRAAIAAAIAVGFMTTHVISGKSELGIYGLLPAAAWVVVPFAVGLAVKLVKEARERERAETIRQHMDDERLRVAQEVHDIVGHGLAAIKMQADIALHVLPKKPEQAATALDTISRTSGVALEELRMALASVRTSTATPGLTLVPELAERMREAGLQVTLEVSGERPVLSSTTDLSGYRIVQESLTNVLRHSGSTQASVTVHYAPDEITIAVANPHTAGARMGRGTGIAGMRQRVEALGGSFTAGPLPQDRFEVRATLPLGGAG